MTPSAALAQILSTASTFADRLVFELIDDSNGDHIFSAAHLHGLYQIARARFDGGDTDPMLRAVVKAFEDDDSNEVV